MAANTRSAATREVSVRPCQISGSPHAPSQQSTSMQRQPCRSTRSYMRASEAEVNWSPVRCSGRRISLCRERNNHCTWPSLRRSGVALLGAAAVSPASCSLLIVKTYGAVSVAFSEAASTASALISAGMGSPCKLCHNPPSCDNGINRPSEGASEGASSGTLPPPASAKGASRCRISAMARTGNLRDSSTHQCKSYKVNISRAAAEAWRCRRAHVGTYA
eukprot:scaffold123586_cov60-Phaeocystis_antarctica.AAC.1